MPPNLSVVARGPILRVTITRPDRRNAFDDDLIEMLRDAFVDAAGRTDCRLVELRGEGEVFSAGADLDWMKRAAGAGPEENRRDALRMYEMFATIARCPIPTVAVVQGAAIGGGMGLVAACDIAIAADDARFGFTEVRLGLIPAVISPFVLRKVRAGDARRYFLTGERFGAGEALRVGLVQLAVAPAALDEAAAKIGEEIFNGGPSAQRHAKRLLDSVPQCDESELGKLTSDWIAELRASDEGREGIRAFLDGRKPSWGSGGLV